MTIELFFFNKIKLLAIKKTKKTERNRDYSDGLWDIPIYKTYIQKENYPTPDIHPCLYASRKEELANCVITSNTQICRKHKI